MNKTIFSITLSMLLVTTTLVVIQSTTAQRYDPNSDHCITMQQIIAFDKAGLNVIGTPLSKDAPNMTATDIIGYKVDCTNGSNITQSELAQSAIEQNKMMSFITPK